MSIDLEAQVLAVAEAMRERDAELEAIRYAPYYLQNRIHLIDYQKRYTIRNYEKVSAYKKAYRAENADAIAAYKKIHYHENFEAFAAYKRAYHAEHYKLKGRPRGENVLSSKLTEESVRNIRSRFSAGETRRGLARAYNVSPPTIVSIISRKTWAHVI